VARKSALGNAARSLPETSDQPPGSPIDRAYLARFTLGSAALEREVLQLFADQVPLYLQALRAARVRKAWREAAHTIKGSASAVGARRLARFAELAEQVDVEADLALSEGYRDEAIAAVAVAAEEACRFIARLLAVAEPEQGQQT
jgi:HPt (histidine-containing phosphotransfer) domain-containing protein